MHRSVFAIISVLLLLFTFALYAQDPLGFNAINTRLNRELTVNERAALRLNATNHMKTKIIASNPWRTKTHGCGGRVFRSAKPGVQISLRYAQWNLSGILKESGAADVILGDSFPRLTRALTGLCAGDIAIVDSSLFAIIHVGQPNSVGEAYATADKLAANVVPIAGSRRHLSCTAICRRGGLRCEERGFVVVNDCDRLRSLFDCVACEVAPAGAAGADMPCVVHSNAPRPFRPRLCLVAPHPKASRCIASHRHTVRLCPCVA